MHFGQATLTYYAVYQFVVQLLLATRKAMSTCQIAILLDRSA